MNTQENLPLQAPSNEEDQRMDTPSSVDEMQTDRQSEGHVWEWITLLGLGLLVYHLLTIWYRWLRPDPEFLGFSASVAELLTIASFIGLQTERGRLAIGRLDRSKFLKGMFSSPKRVALTAWAAAVLAMLFLYAGSPLATRLYREQGVGFLENGQFSDAIQAFEQAISLFPSDSRAHYNLANAYEAIHNTDQAIAQYQIAVELDDDFWPSYNNLGHLYLAARGDPDAALDVLYSGLQQTETLLGQTVITKNIAWALIQKGFPNEALRQLESVEKAFNQLQDESEPVETYLAETYRLRALANTLLGEEDAAIRDWQDCLGYALTVSESSNCRSGVGKPSQDCLDAMKWTAEAREKIAALSGNR
jgi:tetratricopeptide (TPR) repeat protein